MPLPTDLFLPVDAKYNGFVQTDKPLNLNWEVTWSFTFALTGTEHGFCTFLTTNSSLLSGNPGQYLGYLGNIGGFDQSGLFAVGFDTTGLFALSSTSNTGVKLSACKPYSLIIRDYTNSVIFNETLSSLSTEFVLVSSSKVYQTLRFRLTSGGKKLYVDFKKDNTDYKLLASVSLSGYTLSANSVVYPGLAFCTPISGINATASTMFLKNFNVEGSSTTPSNEVVPMISIYETSSTFTTISAISAL